jgi:hypothetical protein
MEERERARWRAVAAFSRRAKHRSKKIIMKCRAICLCLRGSAGKKSAYAKGTL